MASSRGRGGAAAASPVNQRAVDFRRQLDTHTRTLVESFGSLLRSAKITHPQNTAREDFQVNVATASLATAGEGLLRQIREVKLAVMLQDEAAMDREMDQALAKIASERAELEKELEALSNEVKVAYARAAMGGGGRGNARPQDSTAVGGEKEAAVAAAPPPATVPAPSTATAPIPMSGPALALNNAAPAEGQDGPRALLPPTLAASAKAGEVEPAAAMNEVANTGGDAAAAAVLAVPSDTGGSMDVVGAEGIGGEAGTGGAAEFTR